MTMRAPSIAVCAAALCLASASPALATGGLACDSGEGARVDLVLGRMAVLAVADAFFALDDQMWVTSAHLGEGTPITVGQAFGENGLIAVDFMDEIMNDIVARLRLFSMDDGYMLVTGGVFEIAGRGAWVVSCEETG